MTPMLNSGRARLLRQGEIFMKQGWVATLIIFGIAAIVVFGSEPISSGVTATRSQPTVDRSDACFMSQRFVRQNLKAPTTATFPSWTPENCNATQSSGTWKVRSYVDSQNGFGAMIRSDYGVEMRYNPSSDTWTLVDIMIVSP